MASSTDIVGLDKVTKVSGGGFLLEKCGSGRILTREDLSPEQIEISKAAEKFVVGEVGPRVKEIEAKKEGVLVACLKKAGELGFLGVSVPERYGGLGLSKTTSMRMAETLRRVGSFAVTAGAHTGIGTLPLVYYGTHEQKQKYLPKLASGEWVAAYALTEAGSGSDAMAARTTAVPIEGGGYRLNGVKQWITNAAFADVFIVFAQVPDKGFTAFVVERTTKGVSVGPEERKMGIRGSSTCEVILEDAVVPEDALLGQLGRGHKIAFNILNVGRLKLGLGTIGSAKTCLKLAVEYAKERKQFKKTLSEFGLIRQKIGQSAVRIFIGESMGYRTSGLIDRATSEHPVEDDAAAAKVLEEYSIEASILKIWGSETLDWVSDESLQIHGGYGFTEEYPIERIARDSRINRIFEGTNEINRLLIPVMLFKKAAKGQLPLMAFVDETRKEFLSGKGFPNGYDGPLKVEKHAADVAKRTIAFVAAMAFQKYGMALQDRQEVLGALADMIIAAYGLDSAVVRTLQAREKYGEEKAAFFESMTRVFAHDAHEKVLDTARLLAAEMLEGKALDEAFEAIARLPNRIPVKYFAEVDNVAKRVIEVGSYPTIA